MVSMKQQHISKRQGAPVWDHQADWRLKTILTSTVCCKDAVLQAQARHCQTHDRPKAAVAVEVCDVIM